MSGNDHESDLAAFYDQEASTRLTRPIDEPRVALRAGFIEQLRQEGRESVIEVGTGPGRDALEFIAAGIATTGVDLSAEHVRMAREAGIDCTQASLFDLPFATHRFAAGWSMSTLLHIADDRFHDAMASICRVLQPGAPLAIGLWGGIDQEGIVDFDTIQPPRFFSLRSHERIRQMLGEHGTVEQFDTWVHQFGNWEYQFAVVRLPA